MERNGKILLVVLVILVFIGNGLGYRAGQKSVYPQLHRLDEERYTLEQELIGAQEQIQGLEQELQQAQKQIQELGQELGALGQILEEAQERKQALEQELEQAQEQVQTLEQELEIEKTLKPWEKAWLTIFFPLPREVNQTAYFQIIESLTLIYNVQPSGTIFLADEFGYNCILGDRGILVYWNEKQSSEIIVSVETTVFRKVNSNILVATAPHPYPIPEDSIPNDVKQWLEPTFLSPSNDSDIMALAEELVESLEDQAEIVTKTVLWVNQNTKWTINHEEYYQYYDEIVAKYGYFTWTAREVQKYRIGACMELSAFTVALLRAQGIPARTIDGFSIPAEYSETLRKPNFHRWVQVYYQKVGWINYDPTCDAKMHLPRYIELNLNAWWHIWGKDYGGSIAEWSIVSLEDSRGKIKYTVTIFPKEPEEQPEG